MDGRWQPVSRDSRREVKIILHPTAAIYEVRRGMDPGSDDSLDLTPYVKDASHTAFDARVSFVFNRELFGPYQPKPNQVLEIQLQQNNEWKPLWLGHVDSISQFTLSRGERSMQLIAKTRDQQDIWRNTPRVTPLFPQLTDLVYIAQRVARIAEMKGDEIALPPSSVTTAHSNTQLADMSAWDMVSAIFVALGWTPFIDGQGRLRAADRSLQARRADVKLSDDRMIKVGGSRQKPPVNRVRVKWLSPELRMWKQQGRVVQTVTRTVGWWLPKWTETVKYSDDETLRVANPTCTMTKDVNLLVPFIRWKWVPQTPTKGKIEFVNYNFALIPPLMAAWGVSIITTWDQAPPTGGPVIPVGRRAEFVFQMLLVALFMNIGIGTWEITGQPYDWVHAKNISEAFDSSVPTWVNNVQDIECDFITNEEHAKATAIRELIYTARSASKWDVTIVDDPRIEYGDILQFPDQSQLYVEDFSRRLERGAEAVLDVKGFLVGPVRGAGGSLISTVLPPGSSLVPGGPAPGEPGVLPPTPEIPGLPEPPPSGEPTIPNYYDIVAATLAQYNPVVPASGEETGKAQLCRAAAWAIYQQNPKIGLFEKTYGTNVAGMSTDLVVQKGDGSFADVCTAKNNGDGTFTIQATWGDHAGDSNTTDMDRWIQPTQALADMAGPMTKK